jgi:hypothetical protein
LLRETRDKKSYLCTTDVSRWRAARLHAWLVCAETSEHLLKHSNLVSLKSFAGNLKQKQHMKSNDILLLFHDSQARRAQVKCERTCSTGVAPAMYAMMSLTMMRPAGSMNHTRPSNIRGTKNDEGTTVKNTMRCVHANCRN